MLILLNAVYVNPATPGLSLGLPFDKLKALSAAEGLIVGLERRIFTPL